MLKITCGSVLSKKCDLLLLPCNSSGGVTSWVDFEIRFNGLPKPRGKIGFGSIQFRETNARYPIADYVGYAASVDSKTGASALKAITAIAAKALSYAEATDSTIVNLPALGTGAGGLNRDDVLRVYLKQLSKSRILFETFVPDDPSVRLPVDGGTSDVNGDQTPPPRVFISYSRANSDVAGWVRNLSEKLRAKHVDARLDQFLLKPGMDIPQWMTNEIVKASKVILVCDSSYVIKADTRSAGVGWESMIIQGDILSHGTTSRKYIPIAFDNVSENIPLYLRTKLWLPRTEVDEDDGRLVEALYGIEDTTVEETSHP